MSPSRVEISNNTKAPSKVLSPSSLAHVVFLSGNYDCMVDFWVTFLGGAITIRNPMMTFVTYDEEHHRIAIINAAGATRPPPGSTGMHHVAFTFDTLADLAKAYTQRKEHSIVPKGCINHGPTTSMYYEDPDGNTIETQVDNFDTVEETNAFLMSELFMMNPVGTDFDPEDLVQRLEAGEDEAVIKKRVEIGARTLAL